MLVFVDVEHADAHDREYGQRILAARTWITYRLEDLSGRHCHLVRYDRVDAELLDHLDATAIFVSGNSVDPDHYSPESLRRVSELLRTTTLPVFGFCGGFQLLAQSLGADVVPIVPTDDPTVVTLPDGRPFEHGYHPVSPAAGATDHPLLDGLGRAPVFRHAHGLHVPRLPSGFSNLATTAATVNQLAVNDERKMVGTQFHPEYWTDEHPAGRTLIANFIGWAGLGPV